MKIKNPSLRKFAWLTAGAAAVVAPVAIVIACGSPTATSTATEVAVDTANLAKVRVTGDTHNLKFEVPRELIYVSGNALSADGTEQAFEVYGRTGLALGSGVVNNSALNNFNFMPLPLLEAYLAQRLSYVNNRLVITNGETRVDVLATYGSAFGFTSENVIPPRLFGPWSKSEFFLKYVARPGYTAPAAALTTEVPINPAPTGATLNTYVNLDLTYLSAAEQAEFTMAFSYAPTSTQANVAWTNATPTLPAALNNYVTGATYAADNGAATATLPTSFTYAPNARSLFVNLSARPGYVLSTSKLDITRVAGVKAIPTLLDDSPEYPEIDLSKVQLNIANNRIALDQTGVVLPRGAKLEFRLGDGPWVDSVAGLIETLPTTTSTNFDVMRVRLAGTNADGAVYVVGTDKETALASTPGVTIVKTRAFFERAAQLKIDADQSTPSALVWTNPPTVPDELTTAVAQAEYLIGDYATAAQASASNNWSATLPTTLPTTNTAATRLWTRLVPNTSYFLTPELADLTTSSGLSDFLAAQTFVNVGDLVTQAQGLLLTTNSTHDALQWNNPQGVVIPATLASAVARVEYLSGNYASAASATAAPAEAWTSTLPQLLDAESTARYLWVRFVPVNDARLSATLLDITNTSRVQEIVTRIDGLPAYTSFTTGAVKITVTPDNKLAATTPPLPLGTILQYRYGTTGTWSSLSDLTSAFDAASQYDAAAVMVRLFNTNTSKYVLNNDKAGAPDTSALAGFLDLSRYFTALESLQVDAPASTPALLVWQNIPTLTGAESAGIEQLEWIIGAYATIDEIPADALWSSTLPTTFTPPLAPRNLWVRVTPKAGYFLKSELTKGLFPATTRLDAVVAGTDTSSFTAPANALRADPNSTHDALAFTNVPTVPSDLTAAVSGIEYLSGNYPSITAANAATTWSATLPTSTEFDAANRYLYARLVARAGYTLNQSVFDLSVSSQLRDVRAKVDAQPGYAALDLGSITLTGTLLEATLNTAPITLPAGAVIRYQITPASLGASGWLTSIALTTYLNTNLEQITTADIATLRAHFEPSDASRFVVVDDRAAAVNTTNFKRLVDVDLTASFNAQLATALVVSATARHNALTWTNAVPALPTSVQTLEFLTGDFSTAAAASAAPGWTTTLPTTTTYEHARRYFWARLTAARGYNIVSPTVLDLTASSQIQAVLAVVDATPNYAAVNLGLIKITGSLVNAKIDASAVTVPSGAVLRYQIEGKSEPLSAVDFVTFLSDNVNTLTETDVENMSALLITSDALKFVVNDNRRALLDRTGFSYGENVDIAPLTSALQNLAPTSAARHDNVVWNGGTPPLPMGVVSVEYLSGNYATAAAAAAAPVSAWSTSLPTSTSYTHAERYLWARINLAPGYSTTSARVVDLTATSNIQAVLSVVDTRPDYAAIDLSQIKITGGLVASEIDATAVNVPPGAVLRYQITIAASGASGWLAASEFTTYLATNLESITQADLATIRAQFVPSDAAYFVINDPLTKPIDVSQLTLLIDLDLSTSLNAPLAALQVLSTSRNTKVDWNSAVPTLPEHVTTVEFISGTFATSAAAEAGTTWAATLPTTTPYEPTDRNVWARITAARGYQITSGRVLDLTTSSQVRSIIGVIDSTPEYAALDLSKVKITNALYRALLFPNIVLLPAHTHLEYQINTASGYSTWMLADAFIAFLKDNYDNISETNVTEVRAQLVNDDPARYELLNTKTATIDTTEFKRDLPVDVEALIIAFQEMRPAAGATNENATWTDTVLSYDSLTIEYTADPTSQQLAEPLATSTIVWTSTVPTTFTNDKTAMGLWVRLTAAKGYALPATIVSAASDKYIWWNKSVAYLNVTDFTAARTITSLIDASLLDAYYAAANKITITLDRKDGFFAYIKWAPANLNEVPAFLRNVGGKVRYFLFNGQQPNLPNDQPPYNLDEAAQVQRYITKYPTTRSVTTTPQLQTSLVPEYRTAWILLNLNDNYAIKGRETERYFFVSKIDMIRAL